MSNIYRLAVTKLTSGATPLTSPCTNDACYNKIQFKNSLQEQGGSKK